MSVETRCPADPSGVAAGKVSFSGRGDVAVLRRYAAV